MHTVADSKTSRHIHWLTTRITKVNAFLCLHIERDQTHALIVYRTYLFSVRALL